MTSSVNNYTDLLLTNHIANKLLVAIHRSNCNDVIISHCKYYWKMSNIFASLFYKMICCKPCFAGRSSRNAVAVAFVSPGPVPDECNITRQDKTCPVELFQVSSASDKRGGGSMGSISWDGSVWIPLDNSEECGPPTTCWGGKRGLFIYFICCACLFCFVCLFVFCY